MSSDVYVGVETTSEGFPIFQDMFYIWKTGKGFLESLKVLGDFEGPGSACA